MLNLRTCSHTGNNSGSPYCVTDIPAGTLAYISSLQPLVLRSGRCAFADCHIKNTVLVLMILDLIINYSEAEPTYKHEIKYYINNIHDDISKHIAPRWRKCRCKRPQAHW